MRGLTGRARRPAAVALGGGRPRRAQPFIASGAMALLSGLLALLLAPQVLANRNAVGQTPIMGWSGCEYTALPAAHASAPSLTQMNPAASALTHPARA